MTTMPSGVTVTQLMPGVPDLQHIYSLRYQVYAEELRMQPQNIDRKLVDNYDDYSTSFLAKRGKTAVGTIRVTLARNGPLEIAELYPNWRLHLHDARERGEHLAQLGRFVVRTDERHRKEAGPKLVRGALEFCRAEGITRLFFGAPLMQIKNYERYGGYLVDDNACFVSLNGEPLPSAYVLMASDVTDETLAKVQERCPP